MSYDHKAIESRWQKRWESERVFYVTEDDTKPKFYNVCMYPYPSGAIHQGPKRGGPAPVMMQQTLTMRGCVPYAWPRRGSKRLRPRS